MIDYSKLNDAELKKLGTTRQELEEAMQLLGKKKERAAKIASGEIKGYTSKKRSEMTPAELKVVKTRESRMFAKQSLLKAKAIAAGLTVTDAEIDAYIKAKTK